MVQIECFIHGNYRWNEGKGNMSSEFGLVGVHEMELVWLIDEDIANYNKKIPRFSTSIQSSNSSSACVHK
jgi:hypothetical protein